MLAIGEKSGIPEFSVKFAWNHSLCMPRGPVLGELRPFAMPCAAEFDVCKISNGVGPARQLLMKRAEARAQ
jgi:hypothetical protein